LDLGAGAGLPGIPLALALPELKVTLVDAVNKKVTFLKQVVVRLGLQGRVRAVHLRAGGRPAEEGLALAEVVISRALMDLDRWLPFALPYLAPGGRLVAMLARRPPGLEAAGASSGLRLASARELQLPFSKDPRCLAVFVRST
jgi:16S rRNA (guanine527-N7)-methyltransferase